MKRDESRDGDGVYEFVTTREALSTAAAISCHSAVRIARGSLPAGIRDAKGTIEDDGPWTQCSPIFGRRSAYWEANIGMRKRSERGAVLVVW